MVHDCGRSNKPPLPDIKVEKREWNYASAFIKGNNDIETDSRMHCVKSIKNFLVDIRTNNYFVKHSKIFN